MWRRCTSLAFPTVLLAFQQPCQLLDNTSIEPASPDWPDAYSYNKVYGLCLSIHKFIFSQGDLPPGKHVHRSFRIRIFQNSNFARKSSNADHIYIATAKADHLSLKIWLIKNLLYRRVARHRYAGHHDSQSTCIFSIAKVSSRVRVKVCDWFQCCILTVT